jgi:hypothetical protein
MIRDQLVRYFFIPLVIWLGFSGFHDVSAEPQDLNSILEPAKTPPATPIALSRETQTVLLGIGDSLTQGTMDATVNTAGTLNAYLQKIADSLEQVMNVVFTQPLLDDDGNRLLPFSLPTNLGVDGSDLFSVEGIEYYKRVGTRISYVNPHYLCKWILPGRLHSQYDKVLYPIDLLAHHPVSQIGSAIWLLNQYRSPASCNNKTIVVFWMGNNDSSVAALGFGGANPMFLPIPLDQIDPEISPELRSLLHFAQNNGSVSFSPYTLNNIERNLTTLQDFTDQYDHLLTHLKTEGLRSSEQVELFLLTLPYYSSIGYLFDSEDLEYYLEKITPAYTVPPTFRRVAAPGQPITDPVKGDRVSLLTFGFMYLLLHSGYSTEYVNQILETNGKQNDGLVLSEEEQRYIMARIDGYNAAIKDIATHYGPHAHLIDIGQYLNDTLTGKTTFIINNRIINRKWCRSGSFSLDGVHPSYTGHALIANYMLQQLDEILGISAPQYDLREVMQRDPYVDRDGDGWVSGPQHEATGLTELLFLFRDPNDADAAVQPQLPADVWKRISDIIVRGYTASSYVQYAAHPLWLGFPAMQ